MLATVTPSYVPALSLMLSDLGQPCVHDLAKFWGVTERTVWRWLADDVAPRPAGLALYWLTRWGQSHRECEAINRARVACGLHESLARENAALRHELARVVRVGDFGCANAPTALDLPSSVRSA